MATAKLIQAPPAPPPEPTGVTLELTMEEAGLVMALTGACNGSTTRAFAVYHALEAALPKEHHKKLICTDPVARGYCIDMHSGYAAVVPRASL